MKGLPLLLKNGPQELHSSDEWTVGASWKLLQDTEGILHAGVIINSLATAAACISGHRQEVGVISDPRGGEAGVTT